MESLQQSDLNTIWIHVLKNFEDNEIVDSAIFHSYIKNSYLYSLKNNIATISIQYATTISVFEDNKIHFENFLFEELKKEIVCQFVVEKDLVKNKKEENNQNFFAYGNNILKEYTFDNFIQGQSNQQSYSAAYGCSYSKNGSFFNPLFIYGNSGLGKTHLLHAICNYLKSERPNIKFLYIDGNDFISLIINSLQKKNTDKLMSELVNLDYLLIDDIQHFTKANQSQEIFFNIYNKLINKNKQIILTSDVYPSELKNINNRIISRFTSGLSVSITSPEFETAVSILQKKLEGRNKEVNISEDSLYYIAHRFNEDVRKLEGALNELLFKSILYNPTIIDEKFTIEIFKENPIVNASDELTIKKIKKEVCNYYNITIKQIESKSRTADIANARHIAIYLCRELLYDMTYQRIGKEFGNRDHSTIMTSYEKISKLLKQKDDYKKVIKDIKFKLGVH
ncbi:MAG: chromosomal replication initiator protein DnaA [Breznakia sp.]